MVLLFTDGLSEFNQGSGDYVTDLLEARLVQLKDRPVEDICKAVIEDRVRIHQAEDDVSLVVIRRQ